MNVRMAGSGDIEDRQTQGAPTVQGEVHDGHRHRSHVNHTQAHPLLLPHRAAAQPTETPVRLTFIFLAEHALTVQLYIDPSIQLHPRHRDEDDDDEGLEDDEPDVPPSYLDLIRTFQSRYVSVVDR
jgi:hypothetical protein